MLGPSRHSTAQSKGRTIVEGVSLGYWEQNARVSREMCCLEERMLIVRALIAVGVLAKIKLSVQLEYGDGNGGTRTHLAAFASSAFLAILARTT